MVSKIFVCLLISTFAISCCFGGVIPAVPAAFPAAYSIPYASSYNAHVVNHAVAAPAAPLIAAPAPVAVAPPVAYSAFYGK